MRHFRYGPRGERVRIQSFKMERWQSLHDHEVECNLSESGVHPMRLEELVDDSAELKRLMSLDLAYPHTNGSPELRDHIAGFYPGATRDNVLVTCGGAEANYLAFWTLLEKGDRVAVEIPNYMQTVGLARAFGRGVDPFRLRRTRDASRWALDVDSLNRAVTKKTRIILITNPNNPTGAILTEAETDAVVLAARRSGAWIVADEIYRGAELSGRLTPSFWGRHRKVIITAGLSKAFGLPGLRIGWLLAPAKVIPSLWSHKDYTTIAPSLPSDRLAAVAMEPSRRERIFERSRTILHANLPLLEKWIRNHDDLFEHTPPEAGAIALLRYHLPTGSAALAEKLRRDRSVLVVAGEHCGLSGHLRIGYGSPPETLMKGLAGIDLTLAELRKKLPARRRALIRDSATAANGPRDSSLARPLR